MHWRHEQLSLRMALAAATHHSAQPRAKEGLEGETYDAPRQPAWLSREGRGAGSAAHRGAPC